MLEPIADGPFYAIELSPSMLNTQGGPRRNEPGQVVRPDGTPIPRLYSAGELGSIYSYLYPGAPEISASALAFGRVSGRKRAAAGSTLGVERQSVQGNLGRTTASKILVPHRACPEGLHRSWRSAVGPR